MDDAAWSGAILLLLSLLFSVRRQPRRLAACANLSLVLVAASAMLVGGLLLDRGYLAQPVAIRVWHGVAFVLAWTPLAILHGRLPSEPGSRRFLDMMLLLAAIAVGSMLAVRLRAGMQPILVVAVLLASLAALFAGPRLARSERK
ncbi:MAG: hypothetical protein AB8H80_03925 [Planctomycetota bacterium]